MFNQDFYPTKEETTFKMHKGYKIRGKVILEPHGGSGAMIDALRQDEPAEILTCELNPELAIIAKEKADRFLKNDFLQVTAEEISHVDFIIANPPFSNGAEHVLHMIDIAPPGCVILSLINYHSYEFKNTSKKRILASRIDELGSIENWGNEFSDADRKTDVETGYIQITKPGGKDNINYDEYFSLDEEYRGTNDEGVTGYNPMKAIVSHVVSSIELFNETVNATDKMTKTMGPLGSNISFGAFQRSDQGSYDSIDLSQFKKSIQKSAWHYVFSLMNMNKYVTTSVKKDINKFVEEQSKFPFTMNNISKMIEIIIGTQQQRMEGIIVEAFEQICSFAPSNSSAGKTWKTNSDYRVNKKFIRGNMCDYDSRWPKDHVDLTVYSYDDMDDIMKALCHLTGKNFDHFLTLQQHLRYEYRIKVDGNYVGYKGLEDGRNKHTYTADRMLESFKEDNPNSKVELEHHELVPWGEWTTWGFFEVKGHKNGTMHFKFLDDKVWEMFNRKVAEIKGWQLPKETDRKESGSARDKQKGKENMPEVINFFE
jgi:hypothetical protein